MYAKLIVFKLISTKLLTLFSVYVILNNRRTIGYKKLLKDDENEKKFLIS